MSTNGTKKMPEDGQTAPATMGDQERPLRGSGNMTPDAFSGAGRLSDRAVRSGENNGRTPDGEVILGYMPVPPDFKYMDVYLKGRPKHEEFDDFWCRHPPMDLRRRAKIFAPFNALKGMDELRAAQEILYVDRAEPDEDRQRQLNHQLSVLRGYTFNGRMARANQIMVTVEYFTPCTDENHPAFDLHRGRYQTVYGMVLNVDDVKETLRLLTTDGEAVVEFCDIRSITPETDTLFEDVPDDPW